MTDPLIKVGGEAAFSWRARGRGLGLTGLGPVALALALSACATAPRSDNASLAKTGLEVTGTLAGDVNDMSKRLMQGDVQNAFSNTWDTCESKPSLCEAKVPSGELSAARRKLATTISARAKAVSALNGAYGALAAEAAYDARADASAAARNAIDAAQTYATLAGAGADTPLVASVVTYGAGLWADRAQARRLRDDNLKMANAVNLLAKGLAKEKADFERIADEIVQQEVEAHGALARSGLASAGQALDPLTSGLGVTLVKDPDAVLTKSASARAATQAVILASANGKTAALKARYSASLAALDELKRQHLEATDDKPLDLSILNQRLSELDGLLAQLKSN